MRLQHRVLILLLVLALAGCSSPAIATLPPATSPEVALPSATQPAPPSPTVAPSATWTPQQAPIEPPGQLATELAAEPPTGTPTFTAPPAPTSLQSTRDSRFIDCSRTSVGLTPLTDMVAGQKYFGESGGLYGNGQNTPPESHLERARQASAQILPRGPDGSPAPAVPGPEGGRIGLVAIGMSNAKMEFDRFMRIAQIDKSPAVILVDAARPGNVASYWVKPDPNNDPWVFTANVVERAGLTPEQVQVVWLKEANGGPRPGRDDFPVYAQRLRDDMAYMVERVKQEYPNVQIVYLSSRIYAGYSLIELSPEPFAYEGGFSVRWLIQDQMDGGGASGVTYDNAPVLLWGPYLWADGTNSRSDGLTWPCDDFQRDGVHPADAGRQKVAEMLLMFFKNDPLTSVWFNGPRN